MEGFIAGLREFSFFSVILRLLQAMAAGGVIGFGRSKKQRAAGFRTYMLISIGAAMSVLLALYQYEMFKGAWSDAYAAAGNKFDASCLGCQVIAGIGFLGAGIIIEASHQQVKGLTTAAGLWTCGIIGLALGSGYYELGIIGTGLVLLAETWFAVLGRALIKKNPEYAIEVCYTEKMSMDDVLRFCKDSHMSITNLKIHVVENAKEESGGQYIAEVSLRGHGGVRAAGDEDPADAGDHFGSGAVKP